MFVNKKILVTGGTGFIGSRIAERLFLDEKADVRVMVHSWPKAAWVSRLDVELFKADITKYDEVDAAVKDCEIVFHCVGIGGTPEQAMKINAGGTKNVLMACKRHNIKRIVYLSSIVVHGSNISDGLDENAPFVYSGDAYADAKIEAEKVFWSLCTELQLSGSVIRPTYVWGPLSQYYSIDYITQMKKNKFYFVDKGNHDCNAVYVDNVVDLALICANHPKAVGEAFIATDGEQMKWSQFFEYYSNMLNRNINEFKSIPTHDGIDRKTLKFAKLTLQKMIGPLTYLNDKTEIKYPLLAKWLFKAPRKLLKIPLNEIKRILPEMNPVEMEFYSHNGFINITKSLRILGYAPKIAVKQGMADTEIWLRDQNYL